MERATELQGEGNAALRGGDARAACELYTRALALCPASHALWSNRSAARLLLGDAAGAASDARECARLCPASSAASAKASHRLSRALAAAGDLHAAAAAALRCCAAARGSALEPQALDLLADAHCALADDLARLGDPRGAARALSVAVDECPARWELWARRSAALQRLGELTDALSDARHAVELALGPGGPREAGAALPALLRYACVLEALRWFDDAAALYTRCLPLLRAGPGGAQVSEAELCGARDRCQRAHAEAEAALEGCKPAKVALLGCGARLRPDAQVPRDAHSMQVITMPAACGRPQREPGRVVAAFGPALAQWPLELRARPAGGVGVFAKRRIRAGETVYRESALICGVRDRGRCYHCLRALPRRPAECRRSCGRRYCSAECEEAAWGAYHAPLCGPGRAEHFENVANSFSSSALVPMLMWKVLGATMLSGLPRMRQSAFPGPPADVPPFCHLHRCTDYEPGAARPMMRIMADKMMYTHDETCDALGPELRCDPAITVRSVLDLRMAVEANTTVVNSSDPEAQMVDQGKALLMGGSMFGHSCVPSAGWHCSLDTGSLVRFTATRDIKAGEEVTIAYVGESIPWAERQFVLLHRFGFVCKCPKCRKQRASATPEERRKADEMMRSGWLDAF
eukprot:m51a1_g9559 hypothetical protein (637) ;mRNA; f:898647-900557